MKSGKSDDPPTAGSYDGDPEFIISIVNTILVFASLALGIVGVGFIVQSEYTPPPIPAGYIIANIFILLGSGIALQSFISLSVVLGVDGCSPKTYTHTTKTTVRAFLGRGRRDIWGATLLA